MGPEGGVVAEGLADKSREASCGLGLATRSVDDQAPRTGGRTGIPLRARGRRLVLA